MLACTLPLHRLDVFVRHVQTKRSHEGFSGTPPFALRSIGASAQLASTPNLASLPMVPLVLGPGVQVSVLEDTFHTSAGDGTASGFGGDATGTSPWWGGLLLAAWIAHEPRSAFQGCSVIELGCGSSPLPIAAAALRGASPALATDGCPSAVRAARSVLARNCSIVQSCSTRRLAWEDGVANSDVESWGVVLFADVLYIPGSAELLARTIVPLLQHGGQVIGAVGLHRMGASDIFKAMRSHGFIAQEIPVFEPVLSSALEAAVALQKANPHDLKGDHGPAEERCKLVRWVQLRHQQPEQAKADMTDVLHGQAVDALYAQEAKLQMCSSWIPDE